MDDTLSMPDLPGAVLAKGIRLQIPSRPEWIAPTVEYLKEDAGRCGACQPTRANKLLLALHEALTNAIVHGNLEIASHLKERDDNAFAALLAERSADPHYADRTVTIDVDYDGQRCEWSLTDQGQGFDFERYLAATVPVESELWLSSGRGIMLMRAFLDEIRYEMDGRRVVLTLFRASGVERRLHQRLQLHHPVRVVPIRGDGSVDWEAAYEAVAQDLSESGVGLLQARLAQSERLILGLEIDGRPTYIPVQIRHCRTLDEGVVELGCRFLLNAGPPPPPPEQEQEVEVAVEALLDWSRGQPVPPSERRLYPRAPYTERIELSGPPGAPPLLGFARDLSKGGIAFITTSQVPLGPRVILLPRGGEHPLRLRAQVVRCVSITEGFYDVGARFLALESIEDRGIG